MGPEGQCVTSAPDSLQSQLLQVSAAPGDAGPGFVAGRLLAVGRVRAGECPQATCQWTGPGQQSHPGTSLSLSPRFTWLRHPWKNRHWNFPLTLAWFWNGRILRRSLWSFLAGVPDLLRHRLDPQQGDGCSTWAQSNSRATKPWLRDFAVLPSTFFFFFSSVDEWIAL